MSTITPLITTDNGATSLSTINTNFANLNSDKIETSVLDTDSALTANSDTKISTQKAVKTYVDANFPTIETTAGATHSLTTVAGQVVVVWAKAAMSNVGGTPTITLKYNGVTKDTLVLDPNSDFQGVSLMYTETPGAATANITLTTDVGTFTNEKIIVMKL